MLQRTHSSIFWTMMVLCLAMTACKDDPTTPIDGAGDPENVSRVTVTLTPVGGGTAASANRFDPDGSQLPQPVGAASATLVLRKGTTYNGTVGLLNDLDASNVIDISAEVASESNFHRFFHTLTCAGTSVPLASLNRDTQNPSQPFGATFQVVVDAGAATNASCVLRIQLRHFENDKGDGSGSGYETDLDIEFPVSIQP